MKTVIYDLKRNGKIIGAFCIFAFAAIAQFWRRDLSTYSISTLNYYFFWACYVGLVIIITNLHIEDFRYGTIKELYVRTGDAWKILLRRLLSALCVAGIFYVPAIINQMITIQKLTNINPSLNERAYGLELLIIYIGSAAFLSAYVALIAYSVKSYKKAYFIAVLPLIIIDYLLPVIFYQGKLDENGFFGAASRILRITPNGIIKVWAETQRVSCMEALLLLAYIAVLYAITWAVQRRRDCI